jgi:hypothetical protein
VLLRPRPKRAASWRAERCCCAKCSIA